MKKVIFALMCILLFVGFSEVAFAKKKISSSKKTESCKDPVKAQNNLKGAEIWRKRMLKAAQEGDIKAAEAYKAMESAKRKISQAYASGSKRMLRQGWQDIKAAKVLVDALPKKDDKKKEDGKPEEDKAAE